MPRKFSGLCARLLAPAQDAILKPPTDRPSALLIVSNLVRGLVAISGCSNLGRRRTVTTLGS